MLSLRRIPTLIKRPYYNTITNLPSIIEYPKINDENNIDRIRDITDKSYYINSFPIKNITKIEVLKDRFTLLKTLSALPFTGFFSLFMFNEFTVNLYNNDFCIHSEEFCTIPHKELNIIRLKQQN